MERIPILKMGDCLLVTIQVDMHDRLAMALPDDLTNRIAATRARGVVIDISALEVVDSFIVFLFSPISPIPSTFGRSRNSGISAITSRDSATFSASLALMHSHV